MVELPCTAGFRVLWTALLAEQQVVGAALLALLALYLVVYLLDELAVFAVVARRCALAASRSATAGC